MRIISTYRDYYDCIQAYDEDRDFIYLRKLETVEIDNWPFSKLSSYRDDISHEEYVIGFCGKIYPLLIMRQYDVKKLIAELYCYNLDEVEIFVKEHYKKKIIKQYYDNKRYFGFRHKQVKKYFDEYATQQDNYEKMFIDSGHPIFVIERNTNKNHKYNLIYNAELKKYEFYKIFPTALAYQEIVMYLGGVLGQGNPTIPEISNNDMIEAKGFDLKTSFRKDKSK